MNLTILCVLFATIMWSVDGKLDSPPDVSDEKCNWDSEYFEEALQRCCSKCKPGTYVLTKCSSTVDTLCEPCQTGLYIDARNYHNNCFVCRKCKGDRGLQYIKECSSDSNALCTCLTGYYCATQDKESPPSCKECRKFKSCPRGSGVVGQGTVSSNVKCERCPEGKFSDLSSTTQTCQQHKDCESLGRSVESPGNSTSDTICGQVISPSIAVEPMSKASNLSFSPVSVSTSAQSLQITSTNTPLPSPHPSTCSPDIKVTASSTLGGPTAASVNVVIAVCTTSGLLAILTLAICCLRKGSAKTAIKPASEENPADTLSSSSQSISPEQQYLLVEGKHKDPSVSSAESHRESEKSTGAWSGSNCTQEGLITEKPEVSSPLVNLSITATFSCHLNSTAGICSVPLKSSAPSAEPDPQLPLSQEVACNPSQEEEGKDAHQAIQESRKSVCLDE